MLGLGAVGPLAHVPLVGPATAWRLHHGSALILAGLAVLALAMIRGGRTAWTWIPALLALAVAVWTLGQAQPPTAGAAPIAAGARQAAISLLTGDWSIGWGLAALLAGSVLLCFAAGMAAVGRRTAGGRAEA
jgi:hypothetical protein